MATVFPTTGTPPMIGTRLSIAEWLDYVASYDFGTIPPTRLVLHHTYIPNEQQWRGLASMQGMQNYYRGLKWTAAPHIYCGPDGIWLFTPMRDVGIHAGTGNSGRVNGKFWYSIGCEMVGYFDKVLPSGAVWENTKAVLGGLSRRLGIAPDQLISFHRDYTNQKSCPGWAVTKPWVFSEINAWLNNQTPPATSQPGPIGVPTPDTESLIELLNNESFRRRGSGYDASSALQVFAVQNGLGFPIAPVGELSTDGKTYSFQPFARDTLFVELPDQGDVQRLSQLLGGSIPPGGLGRALLDASYKACGATFHPDWAFHQFAMSATLGPPIGESANITIDGTQYSYQVFALDTLFNVVPKWTEIRQLSQLANATDAGQVRLRDVLLGETYKRGGATYHADWAFHQLARQWNLGTPLSDSYRVTSGSQEYAIQVYATDTLYNVIPKWSEVKRLSAATSGGAAVLGEIEIASVVLSADAVFKQPTPEVPIVRFATQRDTPALSRRTREKVDLIVLQGDRGPAEKRLPAFLVPGNRKTPHYYVDKGGTIYQLVDESLAINHAGLAVYDVRRRNINLMSLGVFVERDTDGFSEASLAGLTTLVGWLRKRYDLNKGDVTGWSDLNPQRKDLLDAFPWRDFRKNI